MKNKDLYPEIWQAVHDHESLRVDRDTAVAIADKVTAALDQYDSRILAQRREQIAMQFLRWSAWVLIPSALIIGLFLFIRWSVSLNDQDWAGYGPSKVAKHNEAAVGNWLFESSTLVSQERSKIGEQKAWATEYRIADGEIICVYVWRGEAVSENQSKVIEGGCS